MKNNITIFAIIAISVLILSTSVSIAEIPNKFVPGATALAYEVNENFKFLDDIIISIENKFTPVENKLSVFDNKISLMESNLSVVEDKISSVEDKISAVEDSIFTPQPEFLPHGNFTYSFKYSEVGQEILTTNGSYTILKIPFREFSTSDIYHVKFPSSSKAAYINTSHSGPLFNSNATISGYPAYIYAPICQRSITAYCDSGVRSTYSISGMITIQVHETVFNFQFYNQKKEIVDTNTIDPADHDYTDNFDTSLMIHDTSLISEIDDLIDYIEITKAY